MNAPTHHSVFVIDDDIDVRESIVDVLKDEGYQVEEAVNGAEALEKLRKGYRPAVMLVDLTMPVMGGAELCGCWRNAPELKEIPFVIMSAAGTAQKTADECGASAYIGKPMDLRELLSTVHRFAPAPR